MPAEEQRTTLILKTERSPARTWNDQRYGSPHLIFVRNLQILRYALNSTHESHRDIERIIIDHALSPAEMLSFLTELPDTFHGDVLLIGDHGAFLSAASRGDGRKLWSLKPPDLAFYLTEHRLTSSAAPHDVTHEQPSSRPGAEAHPDRPGGKASRRQ